MPRTVRLLAPPAAGSPLTLGNQTYYRGGGYVDAPYQHAATLTANGWTEVGAVGTTSERPPLRGPSSGDPSVATKGGVYVDTTLSAVICFDGSTWRDPLTGAEV